MGKKITENKSVKDQYAYFQRGFLASFSPAGKEKKLHKIIQSVPASFS